MKRLAKEAYPDPTLRTEYMASFGFFTNVTSFTFALFGTSFLLRKCGLTMSLLLYPLCVFATLVSYGFQFFFLKPFNCYSHTTFF